MDSAEEREWWKKGHKEQNKGNNKFKNVKFEGNSLMK
jgi:hypothetical protein